jgi:hydroxymethylpyrimidine/phosphomethylpyrimidine kinase
VSCSSDHARHDAPKPSVVLCVGGHDPSTAGIQADIETCAAFDTLALTVVTAWTTQNTAVVHKVVAMAVDEVVAQIELLREEFPIHACKLGLLPTAAHCEGLADLFAGPLAGCPLVIDPLLRAGSGGALVQEAVESAFLTWLLPHATVVTPNRQEALHFGATDDIPTAISRLLATGCQAVLLTDALADGPDIVNQLHFCDGRWESFNMARYPGSYHGTGCTLATAIACGLARGQAVRDAVIDAQHFAHTAVARAWHPGSRQPIPRRTPSSRT